MIALVAAVIGAAMVGIIAAAMTAPGPTDRADANPASSPTPVLTPSSSPSPEPSPTPSPEPQPVEFTLVTAGDLLLHMPVIRSAEAQAEGDERYGFGPLMTNVRGYVEGADLALCHLEVPIAPPGVAPTGYPLFGGPVEIVRALKDEGWDGCSLASNHSMDKGLRGLETTLDAFDAEGLGHAGMARAEDEAAVTQMYTVTAGDREITVAHLSYTYGLNGMPKPTGMPWAVDTFDADAADAAPIIEAAGAAREQGADVVVASVHCCVEYRTQPSDAQRSIVEQIGESGLVDLYVGHHAHVPQPIVQVPGGPTGDGMWAAYGLGNYLSNQDTQCCVAATNSGVLMTAMFEVSPEGRVEVEVEWTAVTVDRLNRHTMHVLHEIAQSGAGNLSAAEAQARYGRVADAVGSGVVERTSPATALADAAEARARWERPTDDTQGGEEPED